MVRTRSKKQKAHSLANLRNINGANNPKKSTRKATRKTVSLHVHEETLAKLKAALEAADALKAQIDREQARGNKFQLEKRNVQRRLDRSTQKNADLTAELHLATVGLENAATESDALQEQNETLR